MSLEDKAMKIILEIGAQGILQSDLWKHLETTSREGSRLAVRLEKAGLVKRKKELVDGRWTFRLYAASKTAKIGSLNTLEGCPCFTCPDLSRCGNLHSISPVFCISLDRWLQKISCNTHGEDYYTNAQQKEMS
jgi:DNA-binding MarR family transcriptional regulator